MSSVITPSSMLRYVYGHVRGGSVPVRRRDVEMGMPSQGFVEARWPSLTLCVVLFCPVFVV